MQLEVAVYDPRNPAKKGFCNATITVNRDLNPPVFERNIVTFNLNVWEYENFGYEVLDLNATDADVNVSGKTLVLYCCLILLSYIVVLSFVVLIFFSALLVHRNKYWFYSLTILCLFIYFLVYFISVFCFLNFVVSFDFDMIFFYSKDFVHYYLDGDSVTNAFFEVDDITGKLTLRQPLHGNSRNTYQVRKSFSD